MEQPDAADGRIRVLIVDDDRRFAEVLAILLSAEGRLDVVGYAPDGRDGAALAESLEPDVVLMDLNMPVMDGIEATRRIRASLPATHVLVVSGSASPADVDRARNAGAVGYVTKDRIAEALADRVTTAARRSWAASPA